MILPENYSLPVCLQDLGLLMLAVVSPASFSFASRVATFDSLVSSP